MGVTLTDVLLFGKAQLADVDKATLVVYRRNILRWSALGGYLDIIVKGVAPLSLPDAIADSLTYVKAYGGTEQRNIPAEYVENQFIYMLDGSYLGVTGQSITSDYKIEFDFATTSLSTSLANYFGARASGVAAGGGFRVTKLANNGVAMYGFDTTDAYESGANIMAANTRYKYIYENGTCTLSSGGTDVLTHTYTVNDTSTITAFGINAYTSNGTTFSASGLGIYCYGLKIWNGQGELVADYVPATLLNPLTVGIYDRVSGTHLLPTAGTWSAGPALQEPTPDRPIDIVSNNGTIKARHQSGLPLGYTLLEYIEGDGTKYINTGYFFTDIATETVTIDFMRTGTGTGSLLYGARNAYKDNAYAIQFQDSGNTYIQYGEIDNGLGSQNKGSLNTRYTLTQTGPTYDFNGGRFTSTGTTPTQSYPLYLFASNNSGTPSLITPMRVYSFVIKDSNNNIKLNLVPAKNSSNVIGMYDLVSGTFFTNQGTGDFTAGTPVSDPVEIYTDGTVETIKDTLNNTATTEMLLKVGDYQDVQSIIDGAVTRNCGVLVLDGTEEIWGTASQTPDKVTVLTNCYTVAIPLGNAPIDKRRVYCTHLISSDTLPDASARQGYALLGNGGSTTPDPLLNKYALGLGLTTRFPTIAGLKQWLADQYNAGTPVIIVYPLETETTESVTGQTLQVQAGDNTLEITQASLTGLELEAKYQAAVSLTIQEVQDANLDPNVEVTIN